MNQSRLGSFYEVCISTAIGFGIAFIANAVVMPLYGHPLSVSHNLQITLIFTVISVARSYLVRRYFNAQLQRMARRWAGEKS